MKTPGLILSCFLLNLCTIFSFSKDRPAPIDTIPCETYPGVIDRKPDLPSPFLSGNGEEYVVAVTREKKWAIIPVTLSNEGWMCPQLIVDTLDFPELARTGLHTEESLDSIETITGRSLEEITELGRPGGLSQGGFLAEDERILAVIRGDNRIVCRMGLTHPQLARPIFHVLNMMDTDLSLNRWNMAKHRWDNISSFYYHGQTVLVEAEDTKGGQQSIFDDQIDGAFYIRLWREFREDETAYLKSRYGFLADDQFNALRAALHVIHTGEMQPQYIMRYGFYEGHTFWRTDPVAIAFIFGLKSLPELDRVFDGRLHEILLAHHAARYFE